MRLNAFTVPSVTDFGNEMFQKIVDISYQKAAQSEVLFCRWKHFHVIAFVVFRIYISLRYVDNILTHRSNFSSVIPTQLEFRAIVVIIRISNKQRGNPH